MRVVGGEGEEAAAPLERLVPVDGRVAAADLELAAGVPHLDAEQARARLPLLGAETAPVRVREIGNASVRVDPRHDLRQRGELVLRDLRVGVDAEGEDVRVVLRAAAPGVQLDGGDDERLPRRPLRRPHPVVGDGEDVVAGPLVVPDELVRGQIAVRVGRMRVKRAFEPDPVGVEGAHRASLSRDLVNVR